jgi:integrase
VSRPRKPRQRSTPPDPGRWPACARCGEHYPPAARWPEGPVCACCYTAARRTKGTCADCGHAGLVPGINAARQPTCLRCSGLPLNQTCRGCGDETDLAKGQTCWRCLLTGMTRELLAGPDGTIPPGLEPLATAICSMPRPNSGVTWLRTNPKTRELLHALASGTVDLTHEALDGLPASHTVEYLRGLLVTSHALPPRDRRLATFERWLRAKLEGIEHPEHRQVTERFGRWHHLRDLRRQAAAGPLAEGPFLAAKQSVTVAITFLGWLHQRGQTLAGCTQHDIDARYASGTGTRQKAERFLYWCRTQRLTRTLDIPRRNNQNPALIGETQRLQIIRSLLLHDDLPLTYRVAGSLIALLGQPAGRVVSLALSDIDIQDGAVRVRLARDWLDVPQPLAALLARHAANRANTSTAANASSTWLFPGGMPGDHLSRDYLLQVLRTAGIPVLATRNATWQQLTRHAPPQVLADALGIIPATAMRHANQAGSDWARYAAAASRAHHTQA